MSSAQWRTVLQTKDLPPGSKRAVRLAEGGARVLLVHHEDGSLHAIDLRCPHEGYPLSDGYVDGDCVITCAWHNWKFDLRTGNAVLGGGEGVRRWPVRVDGRNIQVDAQQPSSADAIKAAGASLLQALQDGRLGRALRDAGRMLKAGATPEDVLVLVARDDARRAEWGSTHVLPLAMDCATLAARGVDLTARLHAIAPALDLAVQRNVRLVARPLPPGIAQLVEEARAGVDLGRPLAAAVEAEDSGRAEAIVRAAFRADVPRSVVERWFVKIVGQHFTDFGHPIIYLAKLQQLAAHMGDRLSRDAMEDLYAGLIVNHTLGTREDTLPYLRKYFDGPMITRALPVGEAALDADRDEALGALQCAWVTKGRRATDIADALIGAAARRMWRFDSTLEHTHQIEENWLTVTHRLTVAVAVRQLVQDLPDELALPLLRQVLAFVHSARAVDAKRRRTREPYKRDDFSEKMMKTAIRSCMPSTPHLVARWLAEGYGPDLPIREALVKLLADRYAWPIVRAHAIKTILAAEQAWNLMDPKDPYRRMPLMAAFRFFVAPLKERSLHTQVHGAVRFLNEGKPPKRLTR